MPRATLLVLVLVSAVVGSFPATVAAEEGPTITGQVITSHDGTPIVSTLFLPPGASEDAPVPLVLRTHGWGGTGETEVGGTLARLLDEGYAVLTWDQRGFGCSGGTVHIDAPDAEGRDVSALIDWAVANAPIATVDGDPIVGMSGGSYAGGIQLAAAAVDDRLDALAPEIAWSDLRYSLFSGQVVNQGWVAALYAAGKATAELLGLSPDCPAGPQTGGLEPDIDRGVVEFLTTGTVSPETLAFFATSSLAAFGVDRPVAVPTLVLQGSTDTLFDLTDGYGIYEHVRDQGVDARFVAFCGGHVACPASYADAGDRAHLDDAIVAWFARHLKGEDVPTGPPVEYRTNEGIWRAATSMPAADAVDVPLGGDAEGLLVVPVVDLPDLEAAADLVAVPSGLPALPITSSTPTAAGDPRGATFPVAAADGGPVELFGIPRVTLTVSGTTVPLDQVVGPISDALADLGVLEQVGDLLVGDLGPLEGIVAGLGGVTELAGLGTPTAHVFVKFVHRETGEVVNLQEGAVAVDLSAGEVTVEVPMPGLAYTLPDGHHLDVQVATNSLMHATGRVPAVLDVSLSGSVPLTGSATVPDDDGTDDDGTDDDGTDDDGTDDDGAAEDGAPGGTPPPSVTDTGPARAPGVPLPVTGGGIGAALVALGLAAALRPRRT